MKTLVLILSILFSLTSCSGDNPKTTSITFTEIGEGALSGDGSEGIAQSNIVIKNTTDWQNLITQMNSFNNVSSSFSETDIDFDNYLIIAVFLEVKPNGWEVEITEVTENENSLVVSTKETEFVSSVISQPYSIVKIRKTEKTIEFE
ncbi:MAG: protease complex subunit PrcB family protein [Jejuia sp.]